MNMQMKQGLWQQQTLKLAMTQELTQAITLLQYSAQELAEFLESKAVENPFIQLEMPNLKALNKDRQRITSTKTDEKNWIEHIPDFSYKLTDHIYSQFQLMRLTKKEKRILDFLLNEIDENGYMKINSEDAAKLLKLEERFVIQIMNKVRRVEPAGIGARDLQDCLLMQIERRLDAPFLAEVIIRRHFTEFAKKNWKPLAKKLNVNLKEIQEAADFIKTLNPRPGAHFSCEAPSYVQPDLTVKIAEDMIEVHLLDEDLPKVIFQRKYYDELAAHSDKKLTKFIKEKEKDYQWLLRSLEQRQQTIQRVGLKIVEKQRAFFFEGSESLQPLTMKEIADELAIHESTVSRTVRGKYMQTPFGTFELKWFFPSGLAAEFGGEAASSNQVRTRIESLISAEDKKKPLSDQLICTILSGEGLAVSRRTIAKYREQLHIPSSSKRKRYD